MNFKYPSRFIAKEYCGNVVPATVEMVSNWYCVVSVSTKELLIGKRESKRNTEL